MAVYNITLNLTIEVEADDISDAKTEFWQNLNDNIGNLDLEVEEL